MAIDVEDRSRTFAIPDGASGNAQQALDWREEHPSDTADAGTRTGWARARQLASDDKITLDDLITIRAWFARHEGNAAVAPEHEGKPWRDAGYLMWLAWGGDTMRTFAEETVGRYEKSGVGRRCSACGYTVRGADADTCPCCRSAMPAKAEPELESAPAPVSKPVGPWPTFDACVLAMQGQGHDEDAARAICGAIEQQQEAVAGRASKSIPPDLLDRARPATMSQASDADLLALHDELHAAYAEAGEADEDKAGWYNAHREVVTALEGRGLDHPAPTTGEGLDDLGELLRSTQRKALRQPPEAADPEPPRAAGTSPGRSRPAPSTEEERPSLRGGLHDDRTRKSIRVSRVWKRGAADLDDVWLGLVYEPYTQDAHGEWMRPETIRRAARAWLAWFQAWNEEHESALPRGEVSVTMSWVQPVDGTDADGNAYRADAWYVEVKLYGATLERAKAGEFTGFSLEGSGFIVDHAAMDEDAAA